MLLAGAMPLAGAMLLAGAIAWAGAMPALCFLCIVGAGVAIMPLGAIALDGAPCCAMAFVAAMPPAVGTVAAVAMPPRVMLPAASTAIVNRFMKSPFVADVRRRRSIVAFPDMQRTIRIDADLVTGFGGRLSPM
jgi:hypothetical protein